MMQQAQAEEIVRRLAAGIRGAELYSPAHPVVQRCVDALEGAVGSALQSAPSIVIGVLGDEVVVDSARVAGGRDAFAGFARELRDQAIEKITISGGVSRDELRAFVTALGDRRSEIPLADRLATTGVQHIAIGRIAVDDSDDQQTGIAAARRVYASAIDAAESLWNQAKAGDGPDPSAARSVVDSLAKLVDQDRTSLMALAALKQHDKYTFTHMVNVSTLAMAQARALDINGPLLRDFGYAALMHDIGKVKTPPEVLNKPGALTREEFDLMKRHVIDGAQILRKTPETPAVAPIVAFEHHLKQDFSGYPENVPQRPLNLCTMIVTLADVFDALRSNRPYRDGLATARVRAIMAEQESPAFNHALLKRFVNLVGLFPVGSLVRLSTDELAVVTAEHACDPFRPQVKVIADRDGARLEQPILANTWERDARGEHPRAVVEAVDPEPLGIDPLEYL